jgi:hypothetical protein
MSGTFPKMSVLCRKPSRFIKNLRVSQKPPRFIKNLCASSKTSPLYQKTSALYAAHKQVKVTTYSIQQSASSYVWPGKVPQWLVLSLLLLVLLLLRRCCSFLVQLLSNYSSALANLEESHLDLHLSRGRGMHQRGAPA